MPNTSKVRTGLPMLFAALTLLWGPFNVGLAAQGTTGTILGTVTDSSGGAVPDANVQVTNAGTGATQTIAADAQGRYRAPDLPVGEYQLSLKKLASNPWCIRESRSVLARTWSSILSCPLARSRSA